MDRISRLPDELRIHILSFLNTKHAVATSILSSRWIHLWKSVPVIDFDFSDVVRRTDYTDYDDSLYIDPAKYIEKCERDKCRRKECERLFLGLVTKVLSLNLSPNISKFRLRFPKTDHDYTDEIAKWVQSVFARNVVEVDITIPRQHNSKDHCLKIGPCHTLEILRIDGDFDIALEPNLVSFPNLKKLHLNFCGLGIESLAKLCTGLPRLEVLRLSVLSVTDLAGGFPHGKRDLRFNFSGSALKSVYFDWFEEYNEDWNLNVVVDAPNLEYLHLKNLFAASYMVKNQPAISEVKLGIQLVEGGVSNNGLGDDFDDAAGDFSYRPIIGILEDICNTNVLSIRNTTMRALIRSGHNKLPVFHSLTKLALALHCSGWNLFLHFLHSCPNLKFLDIKKGYMAADNIEGLVSWSQPESVPTCLLFHLKELGIKGLPDQLKEKVVTYILKNAKVLEKIIIKPYLIDVLKDDVL